MDEQPRIRILIVASSPLARAGVAMLLGREPQFAIAGQAAETDLPDAVEWFQPTTIVWDVGWEPLDALERLGETAAGRLAPPVIALAAEPAQPADALAALVGANVRAVLPQSASADVLCAAVAAVDHGLLVLVPGTLSGTAARVALAPPPAAPPPDLLTARESEVLHLIAEGLPNKTIAARLLISEHTVKFHVNALLAKLNAQSRTEAVVRATRMGLIAL